MGVFNYFIKQLDITECSEKSMATIAINKPFLKGIKILKKGLLQKIWAEHSHRNHFCQKVKCINSQNSKYFQN